MRATLTIPQIVSAYCSTCTMPNYGVDERVRSFAPGYEPGDERGACDKCGLRDGNPDHRTIRNASTITFTFDGGAVVFGGDSYEYRSFALEDAEALAAFLASGIGRLKRDADVGAFLDALSDVRQVLRQ